MVLSGRKMTGRVDAGLRCRRDKGVIEGASPRHSDGLFKKSPSLAYYCTIKLVLGMDRQGALYGN